MRVLIADTSARHLQQHIDDVLAVADVDTAEHVTGEWGSMVRPGDVIVADYFADRPSVAEAARRGAVWLHILSAGVDKFDVDALDFPHITCSRGISGGPIAEFVLAMMLAQEKRLRQVFAGERVQLPLGELRGQTLAVFGLGAIGGATARLGLAFGMRVKATRRRAADPLPDELTAVELVDDLAALVAGADHVAICAALTPATRWAFDDSILGAMKPGAHLVNIARGGIVDTDALLRALDAGRIGHASLDVTDPEPLPEGHPLRSHPRATVTRHISGLVAEAEHRNWQVFVDNLARFGAGRPLDGVVDRRERY